jgi:hypothetical protein
MRVKLHASDNVTKRFVYSNFYCVCNIQVEYFFLKIVRTSEVAKKKFVALSTCLCRKIKYITTSVLK